MIMPAKGVIYEQYRGYETPRFTVIRKDGVIEIREYEPALIAEVELSAERSRAIEDGFVILASYIFGNNLTQEKISMTTPVIQQGRDTTWKVRFMMPGIYDERTVPLPVDERIRLVMSRPTRKVVIRFSGKTSGEQLADNLGRLKSHISDFALDTDGDEQYFFYDSPWTTPSSRRNEIAFDLKRETSRLNLSSLHLLLH